MWYHAESHFRLRMGSFPWWPCNQDSLKCGSSFIRSRRECRYHFPLPMNGSGWDPTCFFLFLLLSLRTPVTCTIYGFYFSECGSCCHVFSFSPCASDYEVRLSAELQLWPVHHDRPSLLYILNPGDGMCAACGIIIFWIFCWNPRPTLFLLTLPTPYCTQVREECDLNFWGIVFINLLSRSIKETNISNVLFLARFSFFLLSTMTLREKPPPLFPDSLAARQLSIFWSTFAPSTQLLVCGWEVLLVFQGSLSTRGVWITWDYIIFELCPLWCCHYVPLDHDIKYPVRDQRRCAWEYYLCCHAKLKVHTKSSFLSTWICALLTPLLFYFRLQNQLTGKGCTSQSPRQSLWSPWDTRNSRINMWTPWTLYKIHKLYKGVNGVHGLSMESMDFWT